MMKKIILTIASVVLCLSALAQVPSGKWNYNSSNAPYGYESGTIEFKSTKDNILAEIKTYGRQFQCKVNQINENLWKFNMNIDGCAIEVSLIPGKNQLKGSAHFEGRDLEILFSHPVVKKKN